MVVSPKNNKVLGFQSLLYYKFILEKKHRVDTVSKKMGISEDYLYKMIRGEREFPKEKISDLTKATNDNDFNKFFLDPCGLKAIRPPNDKTVEKVLRYIYELLGSVLEPKEED